MKGPPAGELAQRLQERAELAASLKEGRWDVALGQLSALRSDVLDVLPLLLLALVVLLLFAWLARRVGRWERPYRRLSPNAFVQDLVRHAMRTAVLLVGTLLALEITGATQLAAAVLGTAGVLGLAIGFAFKDLVENYIAGVLLSLRQPFEPDDHVVIDGHEGKVLRLTSRAAILMTLDGNHLRIPNAQVFKGVMLNYTRNPLRRFTFLVGVGSGEDLAAALRLGVETVGRVAGVIGDPAPWAQIEELGDSSVPVRFFGWVDQRESNFALVRSEALRQVKEALEAAGMDLPEPIYRLRMVAGAAPAADAEREPEPETSVPREPAAPPATDLGTGDAIDRQMAEERAETPPEKDLLRAGAPKE
jgi:small-conductance mechanosensitive channel